jgi:hypothetical protein
MDYFGRTALTSATMTSTTAQSQITVDGMERTRRHPRTSDPQRGGSQVVYSVGFAWEGGFRRGGSRLQA